MNERTIPLGYGDFFEDLIIDMDEPRTTYSPTATGEYVPEFYGGLISQGWSQHLDHANLYGSRITRDPRALKLIAKLYEDQIISLSDLEDGCSWLDAVAYSRLSAAQFCDIDEQGIRITARGAKFVDGLLEIARA